MAMCKDEQDIPNIQGVVVAAALGHERRIRKSGGDPDGMGTFTYVTMEATEGHKLTIILVYRPCAGNIDASGGHNLEATMGTSTQKWKGTRLQPAHSSDMGLREVSGNSKGTRHQIGRIFQWNNDG